MASTMSGNELSMIYLLGNGKYHVGRELQNDRAKSFDLMFIYRKLAIGRSYQTSERVLC